MTTVSRTTTQGKDQEVLNGIETELQSMGTLYLGSETFTPQTLAAFVQHRIDLANAVATARAAWESALREYDAIDKQANRVIADLRRTVMAAFGRDTPKLASFGFLPPRQPMLTSDQRSKAAHKAAATRKARRTMGKKQKALIKGDAAGATASVAASATASTASTAS
jgi:hypothetical protein